MFCPRCAAHNIDDAKYCRVCGADISLLPQLLSGQFSTELARADEAGVEEKEKRHRGKNKGKEKKAPMLEDAFSTIGVGIAFLIISMMVARYMPGGHVWWFWLLIPALACAGEGIGQLIRIKREKALQGARAEPLPTISREAQLKNLPPRNTSEMMMPPPSITEGTTRHLSPEPQPVNRSEPVSRSEEHA
jgi:zinc-ribbon domain